MKNKKVIPFICLAAAVLVAAGILLVRQSAAWLDTDINDPLPQDITVDKMYFDFDGSLGTDFTYADGNNAEFILPGYNLICDNGGKITGVNHSTIATEVRVLITYMDGSTEKDYDSSVTNQILQVDFGSGWAKKSPPDRYYYKSFNAVPLADSADGVPFDVITCLKFKPGIDKATYSGEDTGITITIQAKQDEYVDWATIWSS